MSYSKTLITGTEASPLYRVLQSRIEGQRETITKSVVTGNGEVKAAVSVTRPLNPPIDEVIHS
ncbi:hypothetical protein [Aliidiomarina quisquiliarum]|uniref:hypothetical protein n=1 Tax=Aliidiomarina quisquiliarum TaxID=2938947 RepID=UPI00208F19AA|nr:hypothetical protein [Aliidiomarina quisquiliarum]MCO4320013.1 hypothetical protein [Aliidiomarina quisquiliarum]